VDAPYAGGQGMKMKNMAISTKVYEVKVCRPKRTVRVFVDGVLINPYWVKFKQDELYEFAYVDDTVSVENAENVYTPFSHEEFDKWFVVQEGKVNV
jgi:hypothetical protein